MKFSILVPTTGTREFELDRLFDSLNNQEFSDFELVVVTQINHDMVSQLINSYPDLCVVHLKLEKMGLSYARNIGLKSCKGEWIVFSDDDAWYPADGLKLLNKYTSSGDYEIILTQIFDPIKNQLYKNYPDKAEVLKSKFNLMSKSSIEISIERDKIKKDFDENFGLGAKYVCCEEVDFLINNFSKGNTLYIPSISVYHLKKDRGASEAQLFAKGALYSKQFNRFIACLIVIRDILKGRKNSRKIFWSGFKDYKKITEQSTVD